ncbi:MAG: nucleotidyltransferase domain-containing protein [Candidatus Micrarchaeota archaeon]
MGQIADKRVSSYISRVKKLFSAKVILFGSRARGESLKESDYDLLVISEKFEGMPLRERLQKLYELMIKAPFNADILALTPKEFEELSHKLTIYSEIRKTGVYA